MSDVSMFATKFNDNSKSLQEFEKSLDFLRGKEQIVRSQETEMYFQTMIHILKGITDGFFGKLDAVSDVSPHVSNILKEWHDRDWPVYSEQVNRLLEKLQTESFKLSSQEISILNDVADALDSECQNLVRRMRGGK